VIYLGDLLYRNKEIHLIHKSLSCCLIGEDTARTSGGFVETYQLISP
jgi:hypothetical protein